MARPPVVTWYNVYCGAMALLYGLVAVLGVVFLYLGMNEPTLVDEEFEAAELLMIGLICLAMGIVLMVPYAAAPFLPQKSWVWIVGIILIAVGLTSCLTMVVSIPLLIYWLRPETQRYFGRSVPL